MTHNNLRQVDNLLATYPIISDQVDAKELRVILRELLGVISTKTGSVVEFGCYTGTTSLFIQRLLHTYSHEFHVYDSFEGLPEKTYHDQSPAGLQFQPGLLHARKKQFIANFKKANLQLPVIHKGWFSDLHQEDIPDEIIFAFLDGDYYSSINDSLRLITPKLVHGAVIVVDDYASESLPGAKKAFDEWASRRGVSIKTVASLGIVNYA